MQLKFYNITECKKKISKSLGTAKLTLDGVFLSGNSVQRPKFRVSMTENNINSINYAYVAAFKRYYYITDKTFVGNSVWIISLRVDALKSFVDNIGRSYAIIARTSNTNLANLEISDAMFPVSVDTQYKSQIATVNGNLTWNDSDTAFDTSYVAKQYVLTLAAGNVTVVDGSGNTEQIVSQTGMTYLVTNLNGIKAFISSIGAHFADVLEYLIEIRWFPFVPDHGTKYLTNVYIGNNLNVSINSDQDSRIHILSEITKTVTFSTSLPANANLIGYGSMPPYGTMNVEMRPFGTIPLSLALLRQDMPYNEHHVTFVVNTNVISGIATLSYYAGRYNSDVVDTRIKYLASASVCISVPTVGSHGLYNAISNIGGQAIGAATAGAMAGGKIGGGYGAAIGGAIGAVSGFAIGASTYHDAAIATSGGSNSIVSEHPIVRFISTPILATDLIPRRGLPCGKWLEISTFSSGDFIQCDEIDLDTSGMEDSEIDDIESWMTKGVYI